MIYYTLKTIHIIIATLLTGSLIATPIYQWAYQKQQKNKAIKTTGKLLLTLSLISLAIQPATGFAIIAIKHYEPMAFWVIGTLIAFLGIGCLCLAMIYLQQKSLYQANTTKSQWLVLSISLPLLISLYYLMVNRPDSMSTFL